MTRAATWMWLAVVAAGVLLLLGATAPAADAPRRDKGDDNNEGYDDAEDAFLGGPDPPCMFPCGLMVLLLYVAVLVVAVVLGTALAGVVLVLVAGLGAVCLALAAWLAMQGMWLAAAVVVPVVLGVWLVIAKSRKTQRRSGATGEDGGA